MRTQIVAMAVAAALIISVLPAAVAQPQDEGQILANLSTLTQGVEDSTLIQQYRDARDAWIHARDAFSDAWRAFNTARGTWLGDRNAANAAALREALRTRIAKGIDAIENYLTMAKAWAEKLYRIIPENVRSAIVSEADNDIAWLQTQEALVPTATWSELKTIGQTVNNYWENHKANVKRFVGRLLCAVVDAMINKAEGLSLRLKEKIDNLEAQGTDPTTISAMRTSLASFDSEVASAKADVELAEDQFESISVGNVQTPFLQGRTYISQARDHLRSAWNYLKEIAKAIRNAGGSVAITGTGWLTAEGNGHAYLTGTGTIRVVALESGNMIVSNNATVTIGAGSQGTHQENQEAGTITYTGFGSATVTGTSITVQIDGNGISLVAQGTGTVTLSGNGTYTTHGATESTANWSEAGVAVNLATISAVS